MSTQEPFDLTVSEAADILAVHVDTLIRWTDEGLVPCWRTPLGGHRRYRRSDIDALLQSDGDGSAA